jgi:hypothetical protein
LWRLSVPRENQDNNNSEFIVGDAFGFIELNESILFECVLHRTEGKIHSNHVDRDATDRNDDGVSSGQRR